MFSQQDNKNDERAYLSEPRKTFCHSTLPARYTITEHIVCSSVTWKPRHVNKHRFKRSSTKKSNNIYIYIYLYSPNQAADRLQRRHILALSAPFVEILPSNTTDIKLHHSSNEYKQQCTCIQTLFEPDTKSIIQPTIHILNLFTHWIRNTARQRPCT